MKLLRLCLSVLCLGLTHTATYAQSVGIGTATPHASSKLEVTSTTQGMLVPRVALTATNSASPVSSPATSLLVYNTATAGAGATAVVPGFYFWTAGMWVPIATAATESWSPASKLGKSGFIYAPNALANGAADTVKIDNQGRLSLYTANPGGVPMLDSLIRLDTATGHRLSTVVLTSQTPTGNPNAHMVGTKSLVVVDNAPALGATGALNMITTTRTNPTSIAWDLNANTNRAEYAGTGGMNRCIAQINQAHHSGTGTVGNLFGSMTMAWHDGTGRVSGLVGNIAVAVDSSTNSTDSLPQQVGTISRSEYAGAGYAGVQTGLGGQSWLTGGGDSVNAQFGVHGNAAIRNATGSVRLGVGVFGSVDLAQATGKMHTAYGVLASISKDGSSGSFGDIHGTHITIENAGPVDNAFGLSIRPVTIGSNLNYAIHTYEGRVSLGDYLQLRKTYTPTNSADTAGQTGDVTWDDSYIYVKTSTGWKRTSLTSF